MPCSYGVGMSVVIAGGHCRVALLTPRLPTERSRRVSGIIRQPEQAADVRAADAVPVVADLALATAGQLAQVPAGVQAACRRRSSSPVWGSVTPRGRRTHGRPRRGPRRRRRGRGTVRRGAPLRPALCRGRGPGQELPGRFTRADLPASQGQGRPRPAGPPGPGLHRGKPGLVSRRAGHRPGPPRRPRAGPASGAAAPRHPAERVDRPLGTR